MNCIEYVDHDAEDATEAGAHRYGMVNRLLTPADVDVELLRGALVKLTADLARWNQNAWCAIPGGVAWPTDEELEAGVYHDFELSAEAVARLRTIRDLHRGVLSIDDLGDDPADVEHTQLPVADCGTAFCVAGQVAIDSGHTFVGWAGNSSVTSVVPTARLEELLVGAPDGPNPRSAPVVACEQLRMNGYDAALLFDGSNSLLQIWAYGYAVTDGRLALPDSLPARRDASGWVIEDGIETAAQVREQVMVTVAAIARDRWDRRFAALVDVVALRGQNPWLIDAVTTLQAEIAAEAEAAATSSTAAEIEISDDLEESR